MNSSPPSLNTESDTDAVDRSSVTFGQASSSDSSTDAKSTNSSASTPESNNDKLTPVTKAVTTEAKTKKWPKIVMAVVILALIGGSYLLEFSAASQRSDLESSMNALKSSQSIGSSSSSNAQLSTLKVNGDAIVSSDLKVKGNSTFSSIGANNVNTSGSYKVNGVQISSSNLGDGSNLAKLTADQQFTGSNIFAGSVTVQGSNGIYIGSDVNIVSATQSHSVNLTIPKDSHSKDTICLEDLGNCASASTTTGSAGGDLSGSYPDPTVARIQGITVSLNSLASGDLLGFNGFTFSNGLVANGNLSSGDFANIQGVGNLSSGSIGSSFGSISTGSLVQGSTLNATGELELNGNDINSTGTLSDVAYLDGNNVFTGSGNDTDVEGILFKNTSNSTNAFEIQDSSDNVILDADTSNDVVDIGAATNPDYYTLNVNGTINATDGITVNGETVCTADCNADSGSSYYIQDNNGPDAQSASFDISGSGTLGGNLTVDTDSTSALLIQNATASNTTLSVDTNDNSVGIGTAASADDTLTVGGNADITGTLEVDNNLTVDGHYITGNYNDGTTTITALDGNTIESSSGNDTAGTVTVNASDSDGAGDEIEVSFAQDYASTPYVIVTPIDANASAIDYFVENITTSGFDIAFHIAPSGTYYGFNYMVVQ